MPISVAHKLKPLELARLKGMVKYKRETFRRLLQFYDHQLDPQERPVLDKAMLMLNEDAYGAAMENIRVADRNEAIGDIDDAIENLKSAYLVLDYAIHMTMNYCTGSYTRRDLPAKYKDYSSRY